MVREIPTSREEQIPVIKGILFLIELLRKLELLTDFLDSPDFEKEVDRPLEAIAKIRDPKGRVARFSSYLKKIKKANPRKRHKLIEENISTFERLIDDMKKIAGWSQSDKEQLFYSLLAIKQQMSREESYKKKTTLAAIGIGGVIISIGAWYIAHKKTND